MKKLSLTITMVMAVCLQASVAQQPPAWERDAVDAVLEAVRSPGEGAVERLLESALSPQSSQPPAEMRAAIQQVREEIGGEDFDLSVEKVGDGLLLIFRSGERSQVLALQADETGVRSLTLAESNPFAADPVRRHAMALERSAHMPLSELVQRFESDHFSEPYLAETTSAERRQVLERVQQAVRQAQAVMLDEDNELVSLTLKGRRSAVVRFGLEPTSPFNIDRLEVLDADDAETAPALSWEGLSSHFEQRAAEGFSGVVLAVRDGEMILHRGYGMANATLKLPVQKDTVFGIGSTPIDFTVAGIMLLAQQEKLALDDPITEHFADVPEDKRSMTLRHLFTGQSGLPDFHDQPGDWDPDLAWIDRDEAVRRILSQPLLFAPGASRAHSHSAYGLLAAVIEEVSGLGYAEFMRRHFFDPAGMKRTGMYGDASGLALDDFAVGGGPSHVGLPNVPPNWGPTSWLVMGSGGMYSTAGELRRFYDYVSSGEVLKAPFDAHFGGERVVVGGSDRGFYIFEAQQDPDTFVMMLTNGDGRTTAMRSLSRALERLVLGR